MKVPRLSFWVLSAAFLLSSCGTPPLILEGGANLSDGVLSIAYAEPLTDFSPLNYNATNRKYLANIYEPLLRFDPSFNFETALAVSWGRLDETTWDIHLRRGVYFHDGSPLTASAVIYSLEQAQRDSFSGLGSLLNTIQSVKEVDEDRIEIKTIGPDPLLLNKLTWVNIFPDGTTDFSIPIGTGPYRMISWRDETLKLERFDEYWGPLAYFKEAKLVALPGLEDRMTALLNGEIQILGDVPPQRVSELDAVGIAVESYPSLEMSYLILNQAGVFSDSHLRAAVWAAISPDYANYLGGGYLRTNDQFAPAGTMGYFPDFDSRTIDLEFAKEELAKVKFGADKDLPVLVLDIPSGLEALGEKIQDDLAALDLSVSVKVWGLSDYENHILSGDTDFYFFGWKYDQADSEDFFRSVFHTPSSVVGRFNGFGYSNSTLDQWIDEAAGVMDVSARRDLLRNISRTLLSDQVAIPLFESRVLVGIRPEVRYSVRMDGLILASEVVGNVVE